MASSSHWERGWDVPSGFTQVPPSETNSFPVATDLPPAEATLATLDILVPTYSPLLFRVAHSILRNRAESEDVVQDVFLRVLEHKFKLPSIRDLRVWLVRITWNLALDRRRRIRPDQLDEPFAQSLVAPTAPADQALAEARHIAAVLREIERLPKPERHALLLSAIDELSIIEISTLLNRSESAVRALLFRARTRLRQRLEKGTKA
jgi:RNA polymerase sigma-70 factor (ECF subfamily)